MPSSTSASSQQLTLSSEEIQESPRKYFGFSTEERKNTSEVSFDSSEVSFDSSEEIFLSSEEINFSSLENRKYIGRIEQIDLCNNAPAVARCL